MAEVTNNPAKKRFELTADGHTAILEYDLIDGGIVIAHTEVPPPIEGRGHASALFRAALDSARAEGRRVIPVCTAFAGYVKRHPETHALIDPSVRRSLGLPPEAAG